MLGQLLTDRGFEFAVERAVFASVLHRADLMQMILAVVIDGEGRPICTEMLPGNTADAIVLLPVVDGRASAFILAGYVSSPTAA